MAATCIFYDMLCHFLAIVLLSQTEGSPQQEHLRILFLGNSHTAQHDIPSTVKRLLETDGSGRKVTVELLSGTFLRSIFQNRKTSSKIAKGNWDYVVLQGQEISSSHKYDYSKKEAISLANIARESGAKPLLFAEWSRRGINESYYIYNIYKYISKESRADVVPIGYAFDTALAMNRKLELWASDGNHSSSQGALLASMTIYYWINGTKTDPAHQRVRGVTASRQKLLRTAAKSTVDRARK